jgi:hypothetical protein
MPDAEAALVVSSKLRLPLDLEYLDGRNWRLIGGFTFGSVTLARTIAILARPAPGRCVRGQ